MTPRWWAVLSILLFLLLLPACAPALPSPAPTPTLPAQLTIYSWVDYVPQEVLDAFEQETGVHPILEAYETQEQAAEQLRAGQIYDLILFEKEFIPALLQEGLLAEIDHAALPNYRYLDPNFRDLTIDPGNRYTIPYHWGTSGLLVRTDRVDFPITRWADLWDSRLQGRVALWPLRRPLLGIGLKSLGYSANSEDPAELEQTREHVRTLLTHNLLIDNLSASCIPDLQQGPAVVAYGWAYDALLAQEQGLPIAYILPAEGTIVWGDQFVIPANSPAKAAAEAFLNFILRPQISALLTNHNFYPTPNEAASAFVHPDILRNPLVYPPQAALAHAELIMPLSPEGDALSLTVWERLFPAP